MTGGSTFAPTSADVVLAGFEGATPDEYEEELNKRYEEAGRRQQRSEAEEEQPLLRLQRHRLRRHRLRVALADRNDVQAHLPPISCQYNLATKK